MLALGGLVTQCWTGYTSGWTRWGHTAHIRLSGNIETFENLRYYIFLSLLFQFWPEWPNSLRCQNAFSLEEFKHTLFIFLNTNIKLFVDEILRFNLQVFDTMKM